MEHLVARGHTRIGMITGGSGDPNKGQRVRAYRDAMIENRLDFRSSRVAHVFGRHLVGYEPFLNSSFQ